MVKERVAVILSPLDDVHSQSVAWEIKKLGATTVILDTAAFPGIWSLGVSIRPGEQMDYLLITPEGRELRSQDITGLWWRRAGPSVISEAVESSVHREFCEAESRALLTGWAQGLGQRVINPLAAEISARRKVYQLIIANRMGLRIPETLITNDPAAAASFAAKWPSNLIYKVLTGTSFQFTETRALGDAELEKLPVLNLAPVIFQERVYGVPDIRVTIVDDQVFAAELTPEHREAAIDWRLDMAIEARPHQLPAEIEHQLTTYQRAMGLRYGAYDMRRDPAGDYVFFEVNPGGQFLFVEIQAGLKISRAIAQGLLRDTA